MNGEVLTPILNILDLFGIAIFALSGAAIAAKERQTFVTMGFFALVTGVGGGTVRDLLIDAPVFWITDPRVAGVCLACAVLAWFTPVRLWQGKAFDMGDAVGLAAYAVLGSAKAMAYGVPPIPAALMGVITGCVGGIIRDVVAGRPSIIMQPELYVTAAAVSATVTVVGMMAAQALGVADGSAWGAAFIAGFAVRAAAIQFGWGLPSYGGGAAPDSVEEDRARAEAIEASEAPADPAPKPPAKRASNP
ncbi:MAG: trimeric intracellular cation channel family protein [Pseudomonadota bacterium]